MSIRTTTSRWSPLGFWLAFLTACVCFGWPGQEPSLTERALFALGIAIVFRLDMLERRINGKTIHETSP